MQKIFVFLAIPCALLLVTASCKKTAAIQGTNPINVTVKAGQPYQYDLGLYNDEEGVTITQQATHFQQSEVTRLAFTHVIYTYVPASGYSGTDEVVLQSDRGSTGTGHGKLTSITLHFTITN
jgi:hypothetical protein